MSIIRITIAIAIKAIKMIVITLSQAFKRHCNSIVSALADQSSHLWNHCHLEPAKSWQSGSHHQHHIVNLITIFWLIFKLLRGTRITIFLDALASLESMLAVSNTNILFGNSYFFKSSVYTVYTVSTVSTVSTLHSLYSYKFYLRIFGSTFKHFFYGKKLPPYFWLKIAS